MISDLAARKDLVTNLLRKQVQSIYKEQSDLISMLGLIKTGTLYDAVESRRQFVMQDDSSLNWKIKIDLPIQARFLDMRKYGNNRIYNAVIFGHLYGDFYANLMRIVYATWGDMKVEVENMGSVFQSKSENYYSGKYHLSIEDRMKNRVTLNQNLKQYKK